jgi:hypothetical protein
MIGDLLASMDLLVKMYVGGHGSEVKGMTRRQVEKVGRRIL